MMVSVNWVSTLADTGKIMGGVVAALTLFGSVTKWSKQGPGRRRTWVKGFKQLAPGVRPAYVESLFGEPAFEFRVPVLSVTPGAGSRMGLTERVWPLATDGYLTTWSGESDVLAYSLTVTSKSFKPKIRIGASPYSTGPAFTVRLGRTRLTQVADALDVPYPGQVASWKGARRHEYYETYYFGNPGHYMTWACGVSGAGYQAAEAGAMDRLGPDGSAFLQGDLIENLPVAQFRELADYRSRAVVNSLMVQGPEHVDIFPELPRSGPDHDLVRMLEKPPGLLSGFLLRRHLRRIAEGRLGFRERALRRLPRQFRRGVNRQEVLPPGRELVETAEPENEVL